MNQNQLVKEYLMQNERRINDWISRLELIFLASCFCLAAVNQAGLTSFPVNVLLELCLFFAVAATFPYFCCKHCYNEHFNRIVCLLCLELILCVLACNNVIHLDFLFMLLPVISILYLDRELFVKTSIYCFFAMVVTKIVSYQLLSKDSDVWIRGIYQNVYEEMIILILEYIIFCILLYIILLKLIDMVTSGYCLQQRSDGSVAPAPVIMAEKQVAEAYNTKGLFLEIDQTIQNMIRGKNKTFCVDVDYDLPVQLCGDKEKIKLALINLLSDFLQFTHQGSVFLQVTYEKGILPKKGQNISLCCHITCSQDLSEDIRYGNAMGFALAKNIIQKLNGLILDKTSALEEAKTHYVITFLQKVEDQETILHAKQVHQSEQKELISDSRKIAQDILLAREVKALIVDDSLANQKLVDAILKLYGMTTKCVSSGEEAIEEIKMKKYDLVLIDHMMPVKGGIQTAKEIRQMDDPYFEMVPLVAMTSSLTEEAQQMFYDCGFMSVVPKPIKEADLRQAISECMFI